MTAPARRGAPGGRPARTLDVTDRWDRGDFPSTLYLEGPSEPLKAALLAELRAAWARHVPEAPLARVLRVAETGVEEIVAAYQGTSLFSPRELTIVLEVEDVGRSDKKVQGLAAGIARPAGGSSLVLVESDTETPRKSLEPLRAAAAVRLVANPPSRADLIAWGRRRLAASEIEPEAGAIEAVVEACEGDPLAFFSELGKLVTWSAGPKRLTNADVEQILRPVVGADLPDYLAAVAVGQPLLATQRLGRLLAEGVGEGTILFALSNLVGGALGGWSRHRDLSETLRRRSTPAALARSLDAMFRAEWAWKGGRADVVAVLEQATREVAA